MGTVRRRTVALPIVAVVAVATGAVAAERASSDSAPPTAAAATEQLFASSRVAPLASLPPVAARTVEVLGAQPSTTLDTANIHVVLDRTQRPNLAIYAVQGADGRVCVIDSVSGGACYKSFVDQGEPVGLSATWAPEAGIRRVLVDGVVPDDVTSVDLRVAGRLRKVKLLRGAAYLFLRRGEKISDIGDVTYHLGDGSSISGPFSLESGR
jgi:hypothetical protein